MRNGKAPCEIPTPTLSASIETIRSVEDAKRTSEHTLLKWSAKQEQMRRLRKRVDSDQADVGVEHGERVGTSSHFACSSLWKGEIKMSNRTQVLKSQQGTSHATLARRDADEREARARELTG